MHASQARSHLVFPAVSQHVNLFTPVVSAQALMSHVRTHLAAHNRQQ